MNVNQLIAAGGKEWKSQDGKLHRVYYPMAALIGFDCSYYGTGNISSASLAGQEISNSLAHDYNNLCRDSKVWVDVASGEIGVKLGYSRRIDVSADEIKAALRSRVSAIEA